jgi:transcriptional regulator with XRE-family HTH domain
MPVTYRVPIYVRSLFELARLLGIRQQAIARHLDTTRSNVSMWAHGSRALPVRQGLALVRLLADKLMQADREAKTQARPLYPTRRVTSLLSSPPLTVDVAIPPSTRTTHDQFRAKANAIIGQWRLELMRARGDITQRFVEQVRILEAYKEQDLFAIPPQERAGIDEANREIERCLRYVDQVEQAPETRPWGDGPPMPDYVPVVHLWTAAAMVGIWPEEEDRKYFEDVIRDEPESGR